MEKTRLVWLPDGETILKICSFVSTEYTNVADGRTEWYRMSDGVDRDNIARYSLLGLVG